MDNQCLEQEQLVDLHEYVDIIVKRKKVVAGVFFVFITIAALVNFLLPSVYGVSMIIEPGVGSFSTYGDRIYLSVNENGLAKIEEGIFDERIAKALNLDPRTEFGFKVSHPKKSELIKIYMEQEKKRAGLGVQIFNQLFKELSQDYREKIEYRKESIQREIAALTDTIAEKSAIIRSSEESFKILEKRDRELGEEIKSIRFDSENLNLAREALLKNAKEKTSPAGDISPLLYSNTLQQNVGYFNDLSCKVSEVGLAKEAILKDIKEQQVHIAKIKAQIEQLNLASKGLRDMAIVKGPVVSRHPVRPKKMRNIMLAGFAGFGVGIFLAFFMEFWRPPKRGQKA